MKRKDETKQENKTKINVNIMAILLPFINDETYKRIRKKGRVHNIKDTFIYE